MPIIIWTKSPMANVFAKTAIDYLSDDEIKMPWGFRYRDDYEHNDEIRAAAWQSICDAGWKMGDEGTGSRAWDGVDLYHHRLPNDIHWESLPPWVERTEPNGLRNMLRTSGWFLVGETVAWLADPDWLVELWARSRFAKQYPHPSDFPSGSRTMHLNLIGDRNNLRHQKNVNCLPLEISDSEERWAYSTSMYYDFKVLRQTAGWIMPYENICFVSEYPTQIELDAAERLHCETGPAFTCADGFSIYAWRGTIFPEDWIENKLMPREALRWGNTEQRRVACEMIGWHKILDELKAEIVDKNADPEIGELVSVDFPDSGEEKFLRVMCGTGREFALPVPPDMETALQANAWTWGLEPNEYNPEIRT